MAISHDVSLTLFTNDVRSGRVVNVFDRYDIALDMLRPGSPWTFSLWRSSTADTAIDVARRNTTWTELLTDAKAGGQVLVAIDGAPQLNGTIEELQIVSDRQRGACMVLSGRDLSAAATDWPADPRVNLRNAALEDVLQNLFNRVGVQVIVGAGADAERQVRTRARPGARSARATQTHRRHRVDLAHARPGERVWQVAESIVKKLGYMLWVAPCADGVNNLAVVVDVPNYDQAPMFTFSRREQNGVVPVESNIIDSAFRVQIRDVPTHVYAAGATARGDNTSARIRVPIVNEELVRWPIVAPQSFTHPLWLNSQRSRTPAGAKQEAERAIAHAMRDFRTYHCTVQGHGQMVNGALRLYAINTMATAKDRLGGYTLLDEDMLITRVEFSGSRKEGQTTKLTLGTRGAIQLTPEPAQ